VNSRPSSQLPHRVSVVWFSDLVGWSSLTAENEDQAISLVRRFQAAVRAVVAGDKGRVVKFIGDAALVESPSAEAAVKAAAELRGLMQSGETIRTGVHLGDVAVAPDGDLYGDGVNTAQRIQTAAEPGQIVVSVDVWRQLRNRPSYRFEPLGEQGLKGVESLELYLVLEAPSDSKTVVRTDSSKSAAPESRPVVERSIAVLPFLNLSSDPENEYFSDGITEEILNALVKVSDLKVASRTSSFSFKGHQGDVREIAEKLGVATVLEGSVRKAGHRVRITGQLIGAQDGYHLWSETYDRELEDIFAIQDDIAHSIVTALKATLAVDEGEKLVTATTDNLEAYTLYLKARFQYNKYTEASLRRSLELYEDALAESPNYARAWAGIADSWMRLADDWVAPEKAYGAGKEAAERALELDSQLAEAHTALGKIYTWHEYDITAAEDALRRAVASNPNYTDAHWTLGTLLPAVGRLEEGLREMRTAMKLDPLTAEISQWTARFLLYQRRPADAIEESQRTLELDSGYARAHLTVGLARLMEGDPEAGLESLRRSAELSSSLSFRAFLAYGLAAAGQEPEARRVLDELQVESRKSYVRAEFLAAAYGMLGDRDEAFRQLERAYEQRSAGMIYLHLDPLYDSLRDDPRLAALISRIGLQ